MDTLNTSGNHPGPITTGSWLLRRFPPALLVVAASGLVAGLFRAHVLFLPGLAGMATGGLAGWLVGRLARRDPEEAYSFGFRSGLALGATALYGSMGLLMASLRDPGTALRPLEWIERVLGGRAGEPFFGISRYSLQTQSGTLEGGWWLLFFLLDLVLFAVLFLLAFGTGQSPDDVEGTGEGETVNEGDRRAAAPGGAGPRGALAFVLFAAAALAIMVAPGRVRGTTGGPPPAGAAAGPAVAALQGRWVAGGGASFLGSSERVRTFFLTESGPGELGGASLDRSWYLVGLRPSEDGGLEGLLHVPRGATYRVRIRPPAATGELLVSVVWSSTDGPVDLGFTARRAEP